MLFSSLYYVYRLLFFFFFFYDQTMSSDFDYLYHTGDALVFLQILRYLTKTKLFKTDFYRIFIQATGISAAVLHTPESLAGNIEQTKKDIKIEKKETRAYKRTLISVKDNRPSATYIGTGGVIVLCALVIAMITPDVFTFFRHCRFFPSIYGQK